MLFTEAETATPIKPKRRPASGSQSSDAIAASESGELTLNLICWPLRVGWCRVQVQGKEVKFEKLCGVSQYPQDD